MKFVILDRDGTINHDSDQYIKSPEEWKPIKGSMEAIARLTQAGYRLVVATNQSGIARGLFDMTTLNAIHDAMHRAVVQAGGRIDAIFFCPHAADSECDCRKPKPGMLLEIGRRSGSISGTRSRSTTSRICFRLWYFALKRDSNFLQTILSTIRRKVDRRK